MRKKVISLFLLISLNIIFIMRSNALNFGVELQTFSKSIELINLDTNRSVFQKNSHERAYPASTTKIMTYIIVVENVKDISNTKIKITSKVIDQLLGTDSSLSNIREGDELSIEQLLECLMISSGNDAALVLADYVGNGSVDEFVGKMNQKAMELGCEDTHFTNPHGLYDPQHYTTASDLAKIAIYALDLPKFMEVSSKLASTTLGQDRLLVTTNKLIDKNRGGEYYYPYAKGIKTGYHDEGGYCLVSTATKDKYNYLCVAMGSPCKDSNGAKIETNGAMLDSKKLYDWAFYNLSLKQIVDPQKPLAEVDVDLAWRKDKLLLQALSNYSVIVPSDVVTSSLDIVIDTPKSVDAPIKKGDKIGVAKVCYANQEIAVIDLVATEDVNRSALLYYFKIIKDIFSSKLFFAIVIIITILIILYLMMFFKKNRHRRNKMHKNYSYNKYKRF